MRSQLLALAAVLVMTGTVSAQVLTPAETLGKGNESLFFSENHLFVDGDRLNITYVGYMYGATERFDAYLYVGKTGIFDRTQAWIGVGGTVRLVRYRGITVSSFNVFSTGLHARGDAASVLWNTAIVVSRPVSDTVTVWSGVNALVPLGQRKKGLFTPPNYEWNVPFGGLWTINERLGLALEVDIGHVSAIGMGLSIGL